MNHPNTAAAGLAGALAIVLVWIAGIFGVDMPPEVGAAIATLTAAAVLFFGRLWRLRGTTIAQAQRDRAAS